MTNADKFKSIFGLYATELWSKPEKDFLEWLNADAELFGDSEQLEKDHFADPGNMVGDLISRAEAIEAIKEDKIDLTDPNVVAVFKATGDFEKVETQVMTCDRHIKILKDFPPAQPEIIRCKDCKYARLTYDGSCKYCDVWFPDEAEYMDGDYYCASAEKKSNG